jgi:hypothetical protein
MRVLRRLLPDPTDLVVQGEQMRSAALSWPIAGTTTPALLKPLDSGLVVQGWQTVAPMTDEGPTPPQRSVPFGREARPRLNAGIMTASGFMPVYANECEVRAFAQATSIFTITGVARTSAGTPVPGARVLAFYNETQLVGETLADGGGNYSIRTPYNGEHLITALLPSDRTAAGANALITVTVG